MLEQELNKNANLLTDENQTQIVNVKISDIYPCSYLCDRYTFLYFPGSVYAKYV